MLSTPPLADPRIRVDPFIIDDAGLPQKPNAVILENRNEPWLSWVVTIQGKMFRLQHKLSQFKARGGKPRGQIKGFTYSARLRMLRLIASINWKKIPRALLITLTYPDELASRSPRRRVRDRLHFLMKLERKTGKKIPCLWRMEWQDRKTGEYKGKLVPHYHLLAFGVCFIPWQVVRKCWAEVLKWEGDLATDIRRATTSKQAALYAAKYAAKKSSSPSLDNQPYVNRGGRCWGVFRKSSVPLATEYKFFGLSECEVSKLQELASQVLLNFSPRVNPGFTVLGDKAKKFEKKIGEFGLADSRE